MIAIYCVTNLCNQKRYVGQTSYALKSRLSGHNSAAKRGVTRAGLARAIKKYGVENFVIEQLTSVESRDEANRVEREMILFFDSIKHGYNMLAGGSGKRTAGNPHTKTLEWRKKMSKLRKDCWADPQKREKMIKARWENHRCKKQYLSPVLTKEERSAAVAKANKKRCKSYKFKSPNGDIVDVVGLPEFCNKHSLDATCMSRLARGIYKSHKGWSSTGRAVLGTAKHKRKSAKM